MDREQNPPLFFNAARYFPWIFYLVTCYLAYRYTADRAYAFAIQSMNPSQYTLWHDFFSHLDDGILIPLQHWIGLFFLFSQVTGICTAPCYLLRYPRKSSWYRAVLRRLLVLCCKVMALRFLVLLGAGAIRFGLPHGMNWGPFPSIHQPVPVMLVTSFLCQLNISCFAAVLFLLVTVWKHHGIASYLVCLLFFFLSHLIFYFTPPYLSFRLPAFAACFTYHYICGGYFLESCLSAFGLPWLLGLLFLWLTRPLLRRFPERGEIQ